MLSLDMTADFDTRFRPAYEMFQLDKNACANMLCIRCTLAVKKKSMSGWLLLTNDTLYFWADEGTTSHDVVIPLLDLMMVDAHNVAFVRALHVYTKSGLWNLQVLYHRV